MCRLDATCVDRTSISLAVCRCSHYVDFTSVISSSRLFLGFFFELQAGQDENIDATSDLSARHINMDDRIAAAQRRKLLHMRNQAFERKAAAEAREASRSELAQQRRAAARHGDEPAAVECERRFYAASGSGASWRAREHVTLKHSPRTLRAEQPDGHPLTAVAAGQQKKTIAPISDETYSRLSTQKFKRFTNADCDGDAVLY